MNGIFCRRYSCFVVFGQVFGEAMPGAPKDVLDRPDNATCADCGARRPFWASVDKGILICETCAGIHRQLGTHISTVKSVKLDEWKPEWVATARAIGNAKSNAYFEYNVPAGAKYNSSVAQANGGDKIDFHEGKKLEAWLRDKYDRKKYVKPGELAPKQRLDAGESLDGPGPVSGSSSTAEGKPGAAAHGTASATPASKSVKSTLSGRDRSKGARPSPGDVGASPAGAPGNMAAAFASLGEWAADVGGHAGSERQRRHREDKEHKQKDHKESKDRKEPKEKRHKDSKDRDNSRRREANRLSDNMGMGFGSFPGAPEFSAAPAPMNGDHVRCPESGFPLHRPQPPFQQQLQQQHQKQQEGYLMGQSGMQAPHSQHPGCGPSGSQHQERAYSGIQQTVGAGGHHAPWTARGCPRPADGDPTWHGDLSDSGQFHPGGCGSQAVFSGHRGGYGAGFRGGPGAAKAAAERKMALVAVSRLFRDPAALGLPRDVSLIMPFGLKLDAAEFEPNALKRIREPGESERSRGALSSSKQDSHAAFHSAPAGGCAVFHGNSSVSKETNANGAAAGGDGNGCFGLRGAVSQSSTGLQVGWATAAGGERWQVDEGFEDLRSELRRLGEEMNTLRRERDQMAIMSQSSTLPVSTPGVVPPRVMVPHACGLDPTSPTYTGVSGESPGEDWMSSMPATPMRTEHRQIRPPSEAVLAQRRPWHMYREDFAKYAAVFNQIHSSDGLAAGPGVREVLDRSRLPPEDLFHIWGIADWQQRGALSLAEFACAAHLVAARLDGLALPNTMPPEMVGASTEFAAEWAATSGGGAVTGSARQFSEALPSSAMEEYIQLFSMLNNATGNTGSLRPEDAASVLESTQVAADELLKIWHMCDVDKDGCLNMGEFVCALHLASKRRNGAPLPPGLPPEMMAIASQVSPPKIVPAAVAPPPLERAVSSTQPAPVLQDGSSPWHVDPDDLDGYRLLFDSIDRARCGFLGVEEVRDVLERSRLPPEEQSAIWRLADVDGDGKLTLAEFVFLMHLASRRRRGIALPEELPKELSAVAASAAMQAHLTKPAVPTSSLDCAQEERPHAIMQATSTSSLWVVDEAQMEKYRHVWQLLLPPGAAVLGPDEAKEVLGRSGLSDTDLVQIWGLSVRDHDSGVSFLEFVCAMHLAARRRQGVELPAVLPLELLSSFGGRASSERASAGNNACGMTVASPWVVEPEHLLQYRTSFEAWSKREPTHMAAEEAREILERSGVERSELSHVWVLCDMDRDGRLSFPEFACAMHLVCRRRQGLDLPLELPEELVRSVATAVEQPVSEAHPVAGAVSALLPPSGFAAVQPTPWSLTVEQIQRYRIIFEAHLRRDSRALVADEVREILGKSGLSDHEIDHVWRLSDCDGDGHFAFNEFVYAMHLAHQRRSGVSLPRELPPELVRPPDRQALLALFALGGPGAPPM